MPQSLTSLNYHIIFSTRGREPLLSDIILNRLIDYVGAILKAEKSRLLAAGGMPDHTHWLVSLHQGISVADAPRTIKACSSKWIHQEFPELRQFAWQAGYGAFSVSHSNVEAVRRYILGQVEHHKMTTFQEEFTAFLNRHEIAFDDRYLWD